MPLEITKTKGAPYDYLVWWTVEAHFSLAMFFLCAVYVDGTRRSEGKTAVLGAATTLTATPTTTAASDIRSCDKLRELPVDVIVLVRSLEAGKATNTINLNHILRSDILCSLSDGRELLAQRGPHKAALLSCPPCTCLTTTIILLYSGGIPHRCCGCGRVARASVGAPGRPGRLLDGRALQ